MTLRPGRSRPDRRERRIRPRRRATAAFIAIAIVFVTLIASASAPSPLFVILQDRWGFPSELLTVAFTVYALAQLAALLFASGLSDHLGRRPVIAAAVAAVAISIAMFLFAHDVTWIIAGRVLQGLGAGVATGALSAMITELAPSSLRRLASGLVAAAPLAGLALGAAGTGWVAQIAPDPVAVVFAFFDVALLVGLVAVAVVPETVTRTAGALRSLAPRVRIPYRARREFAAGVPMYAAAWMSAGLYLGLLPSILHETFRLPEGSVPGYLIAALAGLGAITGAATGAAPGRPVAIAGAGVLAGGMAAVATAIHVTSPTLLTVGTLLAGVGFGGTFSGALRLLVPLSHPDDRAELFGGVFIVNYLAFGIPVLIAGALVPAWGVQTTGTLLAASAVTVALAAAAVHVVMARPRPESGRR